MSKARAVNLLEALCLALLCVWIFRAPTTGDILRRFGWSVLYALVAAAVFTVLKHWAERR